MRLVKSLEESGLLIKDIIDNKRHKFINKRQLKMKQKTNVIRHFRS